MPTEGTMKTLIFGDLSHVRSFGANLTSFCLLDDFLKTLGTDEIISVYSMPHIGGRYSPLWRVSKQFPPRFSRYLRDIRLSIKKVSPSSIEYKNVHYNNSFNDLLPNTLASFLDLDNFLSRSDLLRHIERSIRGADRVIINGEGNIVNHIGGTDIGYRVGARFLFVAIFICIRHEIPFSLVNCTIDPKNTIVDEVLAHCLPYASHVSVREPISLKYAKDRLSLSNVVEGADASVGYDFGASLNKKRLNSSVPWVVLGDSSGLRGNGSVVADDIERLIVKFHSIGFRIKLLDCSTPYSNVIGKLARKYGCDWLSDHWLDFKSLQQELRNASLMVSGRWHPSILAASVGVPTVMYGSDSCKSRGFSLRMNSPFIEGGLSGVYEQFSIIEDELSNKRKTEVLRASLEWSEKREANLIRPEHD